MTDESDAIYDLVGYAIAPSRALTKFEQPELDIELQSLLASLAFNPPGVVSTAFDLRYTTTTDDTIGGKTLTVTLLCKLTFDKPKGDIPRSPADTKASTGHE